MFTKNCIINFLVLFASSLLFCTCFANIREEKPESEEYVEVAFNSLLVDFSEEPMAPTKSFSNRDIFGVEIHDDSRNYYAAWLTTDLSSDVIKLVKNKRYICYLVYMPNGRDIVETHSDGTLGMPFMPMGYGTVNPPKLNGGVAYGNYSIDFCNFGCVIKKGMQSRGYAYNYWNDVNIYYGVTEICSSEDIKMTINLYRMMFGLKVRINNLKEGQVKVSEGSTLSTYVYTLTPTNPEMDKVLELAYMPYSQLIPTPDDIPSEETMRNWTTGLGTLNIEYISPKGEAYKIYNKSLETKRLVKYSYTFDLNDLLDGISSSIDAHITDEEWSNENI